MELLHDKLRIKLMGGLELSLKELEDAGCHIGFSHDKKQLTVIMKGITYTYNIKMDKNNPDIVHITGT